MKRIGLFLAMFGLSVGILGAQTPMPVRKPAQIKQRVVAKMRQVRSQAQFAMNVVLACIKELKLTRAGIAMDAREELEALGKQLEKLNKQLEKLAAEKAKKEKEKKKEKLIGPVEKPAEASASAEVGKDPVPLNALYKKGK